MEVRFVFVLFLCFLRASHAARYTVGDSDGWKPDVNYTSWALKQKFYPGDYLVFNYPEGQDTVLEVNRAGYESCASSNPINHHNDGKSVLRLTRPGTHYYISGTADHCAKGQKFSILVISLSGGAPSPSSSTSPPEPSAVPPLKANSSPSNSSAPSTTTASKNTASRSKASIVTVASSIGLVVFRLLISP